MGNFLDISMYNSIIDYNSFIGSGLEGIIIKASEGTTYTDSTMEEKYNGLKGKVNIGFYHFLKSTSLPETQAQHFYDLIKDKQFQIVPVLDVEEDSIKNIGEQYANRFMTEFKKLSGLNIIIYSYSSFIKEHLSNNFCNNNVFWVAQYGVKQHDVLAECKEIVAWQYTDKCTDYRCILGFTDSSILYNPKEFFIRGEQSNSSQRITPSQPKFSTVILQHDLNSQGFKDKNGHELNVDGIPGVLTLSACPVVKYGARGDITRWIQSVMDIEVDGIFGTQTLIAIQKFQKLHGLQQDGIVGVNTWKALLNIQ